MIDSITQIGNSVIHCGRSNNRIYLMSLDVLDLPFIVDQLDRLALEKRYTKIIAKVPSYARAIFQSSGYLEEASVPHFYEGKEDGYFLSKYLEEDRSIDSFKDHCKQVLDKANNKETMQEMKPLDKDFTCRMAGETDVDDMVLVYQQVFKTYPFPIWDKEYLSKTMKENVIYFGIWHKDKLVALSSIELAKKYSNAEMTDFATLEAYRGKGFAYYLLGEMEKTICDLGIHTAYTIARAKSYGMNIAFSKKGYTYAGTLVNNTNIAGNIESMNVWYKSLR